jgi:hypothetical protein
MSISNQQPFGGECPECGTETLVNLTTCHNCGAVDADQDLRATWFVAGGVLAMVSGKECSLDSAFSCLWNLNTSDISEKTALEYFSAGWNTP